MGSLVPGWDAESAVPKDMREFDETAEPKGYFAKLESMRSMRHSHDVPAPAVPVSAHPTLARLSAGSSGGGAGDGIAKLSKCMSERVHDLGSSPNGPSRGLNRSSLDRAKSTKVSSYQGTDWASELDSLRGKGLARTSLTSEEHHEKGDPQGNGWWARMDHGVLNAPVEVDEDVDKEAAKHSTFTPQFGIAGSNLH